MVADRWSRFPFSAIKVIWRRRLAIAFYFAVFCVGWNILDHIRLRGLAEGLNTKETNPLQKVENILDWIENRSHITHGGESEESRDVFKTMQSHALLSSEASASFLFVNLCKASDLKARRLILVTTNFTARHVAAEVLINDTWAVVEPAYFTLLRDQKGNLVSQKDLLRSSVLHEVVAELKGYPADISFANAIHIRLSKLGPPGRWLRKGLAKLYADWETAAYPLIGLLDLTSTSFLAVSIFLLLVCLPGSPRLHVRPFLFFGNFEPRAKARPL